ncbi:MAG: CoA-acylating methylmalonate-semialdehyde dehydrogenase [Chloroflexota bacterium]|nr:CoA-acylating methylmalonate-semialdehyde dehydrogenase [Chloroflexota bacterium]
MQTLKSPIRADITTLPNYIGGEWVDDRDAEALPVLNPATGEAVAMVPLSGPEMVNRAARAAHEAFESWRSVPPIERARYMFPLRDLLLKHGEELARLVTTEHGKVLSDARGSVQRAIENVEVAAGIPTLMMGYGLENGAGRDIDEDAARRPLGVFACIAPFNFPLMVPFWFMPYAIATGNTFIIKPSEQVPLSQRLVFEMMEEIGLPPGVVNLVNGGRDTADALLDHPLVKGVSFVGSTPVARHIYARAAANGKRVQASGGAKNVIVVMPDAVMDKVIPNVINSAFGSSGQRCLAGSIIIPVGEAHGPVREALVASMDRIKVGNGLDPDVVMGPVISAAARDRILGAIRGGVSEGAELLVGGQPADVAGHEGGFFVQPTLFDGVRPGMKLATEEIFGPVLSMMPVATLDEAIRVIDESPYGNAASIFTESGGWAREFQMRVDVGNIGVNIGVAAPMAYFPFGGARQSFFGTQHGQGRDAVDFFTDRRVVIRRWFGGDRADARGHW